VGTQIFKHTLTGVWFCHVFCHIIVTFSFLQIYFCVIQLTQSAHNVIIFTIT
jgi:hypothetical protein